MPKCKVIFARTLKRKGYDLDTVEQKVCKIFGIEPDEIYSKSRQKTRAEARGRVCGAKG